MDPILLPFIVIAALLGIGWYRGGRANYALVLSAVHALERAFTPLDKTYTNIGGTVGYNFVYQLPPPFTRLEGTIVTLPRHAVLYIPISRFILRREDALLCTLYCHALPVGEGHIAEAERYRRGNYPLDDADMLDETPVSRGEGTFLVLSRNPLVRDRLVALLGNLSRETTECLRYLGYYGAGAYVAFTLNPGHSSLERALKDITSVIPIAHTGPETRR